MLIKRAGLRVTSYHYLVHLNLCKASSISLYLSSLDYPFLYALISAPRCRRDLSTVHDSGAVMFSFLDILFMIALLVCVPVLSFAAIFKTLNLHPWRESSFNNGIAPILGFRNSFSVSFM